MLDTLAVLRVLLCASPNMTISQAFGLVSDLNGCLLPAPKTLVEIGRNSPSVIEALRAGRRIEAIKHLRTEGTAAFGETVGLKEAKDVVCDILAFEFPER